MKKLVLLLIPLLLMIATSVAAEGQEVQSVCNLAIPQSVRVFNWATWQAAEIQDQNLYLQPFHWDASQSIWRGYDSATPFDQPLDAFKHYSVTMKQANGQEQWILVLDSQQTPNTDYVYVFTNVEPYADNNGNHYGIHPCVAFAADTSMVNSWLQAAYQG